MTSVEDLWCTHYAWIICTVYTCTVGPGEFWVIRFDQAQPWFLLVPSSTTLIAACWHQPFCLPEWAMVKTQPMVKLRYAKLNKKNSIHPFVKRASPSLNPPSRVPVTCHTCIAPYQPYHIRRGVAGWSGATIVQWTRLLSAYYVPHTACHMAQVTTVLGLGQWVWGIGCFCSISYIIIVFV